VRLYQEMAAAVDSEDARAVRQIIAEEQNHVQELTNARHNLH
jgi:rubrerythrin